MSGQWDIAAQVRHQLEFGSVWQDRDSIDNYDGVVRAIRESGEDRQAFAEAIFHCLTAEIALVRDGAGRTLPEVARDLGAERLDGWVQEHRGRFPDVEPMVAQALLRLVSGPRR